MDEISLTAALVEGRPVSAASLRNTTYDLAPTLYAGFWYYISIVLT